MQGMWELQCKSCEEILQGHDLESQQLAIQITGREIERCDKVPKEIRKVQNPTLVIQGGRNKKKSIVDWNESEESDISYIDIGVHIAK